MNIVEGLAAWAVVSVAFATLVGKFLEIADRRNELKANERLRAAGF